MTEDELVKRYGFEMIQDQRAGEMLFAVRWTMNYLTKEEKKEKVAYFDSKTKLMGFVRGLLNHNPLEVTIEPIKCIDMRQTSNLYGD